MKLLCGYKRGARVRGAFNFFLSISNRLMLIASGLYKQEGNAMFQRWAVTFAAAGLLTTAAVAQNASTPATPDSSPFKTDKEKTSYALGMQIGTGLRKQGVDLDPATVAKGFADAYGGNKTVMSEDEMRLVLRNAQQEFQKQQAAIRAEKAEEARKAGDAFLEANKAKPGVVTLPSGLQYKILKEGTGKKPEATDSVVCNYRGTLIDGTEFDSSAKHNGPATFPVSGVIQGWTQALQLMPAGSRWEIYVPPQLAYGESGAGQAIPPNATLIFDLELVSVKDDQEPAKAPDPQ
jgi:FKBP-type peptidyl-prolyl cis-trans isomerase FklB